MEKVFHTEFGKKFLFILRHQRRTEESGEEFQTGPTAGESPARLPENMFGSLGDGSFRVPTDVRRRTL